MAVKKGAKKAPVVARKTGDKGDINDIAETLRSIKTKFGDEAIMTLDETKKVDVESVSSGSIGLDDALGIGGYPRGRIIEIFGPESSGKTTLSLHAVAEAQKAGGICAFIDAEHAMDPEYARKLGVKLDELLISQPDNGEQALEIVESLVRTGKIDVIVVDSVAALTPRDEIEGEMGAHHVGKQARLMSQALRKLTGIVSKSKTVIIFINQIRMQVGVMFGNPETTPGGKALKFYTSVRLDIRRIAQIKKGEEVVGGRHRVKVVKNKVAPPFRATEFDVLYGEGISIEGELLALGEKYKMVKKSGASYSYLPPGGDESTEMKLGRGYDAARTTVRNDKKLKTELLKNIRKCLKDDAAAGYTGSVASASEDDEVEPAE
ncbi:MAG: protein recombination protein RecA [Candidatus Parcubacteria bacterium]|jgi:recombination protein RecA